MLRTTVPAAAIAAITSLVSIIACEARAQDVRDPAAPITTRELTEIRGLSGLAVSPDGAFAVVRIDQQDVEANVTRLSWHVVPLDGGAVRKVADAGGPTWSNNAFLADERPQWSPDSQWIHFRSLQGEDMQVWRVGRDGAGLQQLTREPADVLAFRVGQDGELLYAISGATRDDIEAAEQKQDDEGVLMGPDIIPHFPMVRGFPHNGRMTTLRTSPDGGGRRQTLLGHLPPRVRVLVSHASQARDVPGDADTGFERRYSVGAGRLSRSGGARFRAPADVDRDANESVLSPDGSAIARIATPAQGEAGGDSRLRLQWRPAGAWGRAVTCLAAACDDVDEVALIGWLPDNRSIVFQTVRFGVEAIGVWDIVSGDVRTVASGHHVLGSDSSGAAGICQLARSEVICVSAAASTPPRVVAIDLMDGRERVLLDPNPDLGPARLGIASTLVVTDSYGSETLGYLILPHDWTPAGTGKRIPLVITSYSCAGFLRGGSGNDVPEQVLAGLGYAAVCLDTTTWVVRRRKGFSHIDDGSASTIQMFEQVVRMLDDMGIVDPERVVVSGFSGSATHITIGLTQWQTFAAAIITTRANTDPITCYLNTQTGICRRRAIAAGETRPPYDGRDTFLANGPALNADSIVTPLMMQLAEVEYPYAMQLYAALLDLGRAVELRVFADEYHAKRKPRHRLSVYDRNVQWARFWLDGNEAYDPALRDQYARWRAMRDGQCGLHEAGAIRVRPWYCNTMAGG